MNLTELTMLSKEYNTNPYDFIEKLDRCHRIIFDNSLNAKVAICYQTVKTLLANTTVFSSELLAVRAEPVMRGKVLVQMQGEEHKHKKAMMAGQLTGRFLKTTYREPLKQLCDNVVSDLNNKDTFDFIADFGKPFSLLSTFCMLGIDSKHLDFYHKRVSLIARFVTGFDLSEEEKSVYIAAAIEMEKAIIDLIQKKQMAPENDLLSLLITQGSKDADQKLNHRDIVALTLNVMLATIEPVDKVLSACIFHLYRNEHLIKGIHAGEIKTNDILHETLRITPPVHLISHLVKENHTTEFGDVLKKGEMIFMLLPAANRDPAFFDHPHTFNPNRSFKSHLSYGSGIHSCIGAQFANMQLNLALEKLVPLLMEYEEKSPPIFNGIYTRGATSYILRRKNVCR